MSRWLFHEVLYSRLTHRLFLPLSFRALMRAPLTFFETTPQGRIQNLFTRDVQVVDEGKSDYIVFDALRPRC